MTIRVRESGLHNMFRNTYSENIKWKTLIHPKEKRDVIWVH